MTLEAKFLTIICSAVAGQNTQTHETQAQNTQAQNTKAQNTQAQNTQAQNTQSPKIPSANKRKRRWASRC